MKIDLPFLGSVREIVKQAGTIIEQIAKEGFETRYKEHMDPVTTADHAVNSFLKEHLLSLLPEAGWLSEETRDSDDRLYVFVNRKVDHVAN